ncbi:MAG: hypothetical protein QOH08_1082 [Chloroflexota bacterium]|nr:hypothetical protein [Chloroflexota bacterium]
MVGKKGKDGDVIDLASRVGVLAPKAPPAPPAPIRRADAPIEPARHHRGRPTMIGLDEPPAAGPIEPRQLRRTDLAVRPMMIGLEEAVAAPGPFAVTREAPGEGEMDLVVTPLATPDDWHHFELALRRVPGVGALRTEYYRAGILKLRLAWSGADRFASAVAAVPGYRVGILGEDRTTVQIRVTRG